MQWHGIEFKKCLHSRFYMEKKLKFTNDVLQKGDKLIMKFTLFLKYNWLK